MTDLTVAEAPRLPAAPAPTSLLNVVAEAARDPAVDVTKLQALLDMQRQVEEREGRREFIAAFSRLSAKLPRVKKNGRIDLISKEGVNKGSVAFARWEDIDAIIRPLMAEEGFTLSFDTIPRTEQGGGLIVTGTLMHVHGESRTASMPVSLDTGPGRNNLQAMGSSLSYGKRYVAEMLLNIVREGADDDGQRGGTERVTAEQAAEIAALIKETASDETRFCQHFQVAAISNLTAGDYARARNMLLEKKGKPAGAAAPQPSPAAGEGQPDPSTAAPDTFWSGSLEIAPEPLQPGKRALNWPAWEGKIRQRAAEALSQTDLDRLLAANTKHLTAFKLAQPQHAETLEALIAASGKRMVSA